MNVTNIVCSCGHTATKHKNNGCNFVTKPKEHPYESDEFCECDVTDRELFVAELARKDERLTAIEQAARELVNNLPEFEIELARENWGNTNTRIILDKRATLAAMLGGEG